MKKILVTGGAGFIGSHVSRYLINKDYYVICVDNLITGSLRNIAGLDKKKFKFLKHDITNPFKIGGKIDFVLHLASPASPIDYLEFPIQTLKVGALGTHNALGIAKTKGAVFLLASTSEVYGDPLIHPQKEDYWGNVNPIGPRSCYDESKRFAEAITVAYKEKHNVDIRIARIFNTYGPRMRKKDGRVMPSFITQALEGKPLTVFGEGTQTRCFCYVDDLVDGIFKLMNSSLTSPVNIGSTEEIKMLELAEKIIKLCNSRSRVEFKELPQDDPQRRRPDINKAKELLKWQPVISLEAGLERTIEWFRKS
ncbi:MAG: UDP-glucuronic acid decarboxylase family protein [Candidatus Omnitrophota bacterium]